MATCNVTFFRITDACRATAGNKAATMPLADASTAVALTALTTSGASQIMQASGTDWTAPYSGVITIDADANLRIAVGTAPTASATTGFRLLAGIQRDFAIPAGHKVAVINA